MLGRVGGDRRRRNPRRRRLADDDAARGEMLGVVGARAHVLVARREIDAAEALGVRDRALFAQLVPDRIRILDPARIEMIEVTRPVIHRRARAHAVSSISIAFSGQLALPSQAFSTRAPGPAPPPFSPPLP